MPTATEVHRVPADQVPDQPSAASTPEKPDMAEALRPLFFDAILPVGAYFVAHDALGASLVVALTISSAFSLARTAWSFFREHRWNQLAILILVTNVAGVAFGLTTGSARFLVAKDSGVSSVIALAILWSVVRGRPLMSEGLIPFVTKGQASRSAALDRLRSTGPFRRLEVRYSVIWGVILLADCVARVIGAYTIAPSTMAWGSTAMLFGAIAVASLLSGVLAAKPITEMVDRAVDEEAPPKA